MVLNYYRADEINRAIKILESKNMIDEESKICLTSIADKWKLFSIYHLLYLY